MLSTPHVIVGATLGIKITNPTISIPLAFASHFILDMTPHWNPGILTEVNKSGKISNRSSYILIIDTLLALITGLILSFIQPVSAQQRMVILMCCFASILPDLLSVPYLFFKQKSGIYKTWMYFKKSIQFDAGLLSGLTNQLITIIAAISWLVN